MILRIVVGATVFLLLLHFFFVWMNSSVDSWYFHAFSTFLKTGKYTDPTGQPYQVVRTGAAPLFSALLALLESIPRADVILHGLQLIVLLVTGLLLFSMLKEYIKKPWAAMFASFFILLPGNLIHVSYVLSDIGAQLLFTLYLFLLFRFFKHKKSHALSLSVLVGFIAGLWRYSFVVFGVISLLMFFASYPRKFRLYIYPVIGILLIGGWVMIQHSFTGVWGLADDVGIRYNIKMMMQGEVLPSEEHPAMKEIRRYISPEVDLRKPYWELEQHLIPHFGYDYVRMVKLVGAVGKAAMWEHPFVYARVTLESFFKSHIGVPYAKNLSTFGTDKSYEYPPLICTSMGTIDYCNPIIMTNVSYSVWNFFVMASNWYYKTIFPIWSFVLFFPMLIWAFIRSDPFFRVAAFCFLVGRLVIAMATWSDPRYVLPFYPLMIFLSVVALKDFISVVRRHFRSVDVFPVLKNRK